MKRVKAAEKNDGFFAGNLPYQTCLKIGLLHIMDHANLEEKMFGFVPKSYF